MARQPTAGSGGADPGQRLVDVHTHILPGVDDGAADALTSLAMARLAVADGITRLLATPHALRLDGGLDPADVQRRACALQKAVAAAGIPLQLGVGAEMPLINALPRLIDARAYLSLNGSRYLLIELPHYGLPGGWENLLWQVQMRGLVPIVAHPERHPELGRDPKGLRRLVDRGCLLQVTSGSLEGAFGAGVQSATRRLLREGLVHLLASDAHNATSRPPQLAKAVDLAAEIVGRDAAWRLAAANPLAVWENRPIT
ncbi:MAG: tyrosine-protein phosphatase [Anaerolineae bacterium]